MTISGHRVASVNAYMTLSCIVARAMVECQPKWTRDRLIKRQPQLDVVAADGAESRALAVSNGSQGEQNVILRLAAVHPFRRLRTFWDHETSRSYQ